MKEQYIHEFRRGIANFAENADYREFCRVCGLNPQTQYAEDKWNAWRDLQFGINALDATALLAIAKAGLRG